jgi:alkanesulfonate monooxygenase SsuD/methylene tetrahydromethanopterin reductase-like flavin-dependent oxidoreductase (luciferase family)
LQLPRPWNEGDERNLFHQALEQVELADRLGFDYAWEVEHHFLEEYSHSSAPEVFLAAAAARTRSIRLGHGIRQVIPNYNHPARTAEGLATLDIISDGRVDFGIGEGATRLELGGFRIAAKEKRAMALEAAEQIANMMVLEPYPGFEGKYFAMPCRNVLPKPVQKPHPPIIVGGAFPHAARRAVAYGDGWIPLASRGLDPLDALTEFRKMAKDAGRDPAALSFDVFAAPREADALKRYRDADVTRAIWMFPSKGREEVLPMLDQCAALMRQL